MHSTLRRWKVKQAVERGSGFSLVKVEGVVVGQQGGVFKKKEVNNDYASIFLFSIYSTVSSSLASYRTSK